MTLPQSNLTRRRCAPTLLLAGAALVGLSACSDDGLVVASGRVLIEGEPVSSGRLSLTPTGDSHADKGKRKPAVALIDSDGAFVLRTGGESPGAAPGAYRALFVDELSEPAGGRGPAVNSAAPEELKVMYESPSERPVVIPDSGADDLTIDIRRESGWMRSLSE